MGLCYRGFIVLGVKGTKKQALVSVGRVLVFDGFVRVSFSFEQHASGEHRCFPSLIGIGSQKSGSTILFARLMYHDENILPGSKKELHFFDFEERWQKGIDSYLVSFPAVDFEATERKISLEFSPSYILTASACKRIRQILPHARLVMLLRDPVERVWSEIQMKLRHDQSVMEFTKKIASTAEFTKCLHRYAHMDGLPLNSPTTNEDGCARPQHFPSPYRKENPRRSLSHLVSTPVLQGNADTGERHTDMEGTWKPALVDRSFTLLLDPLRSLNGTLGGRAERKRLVQSCVPTSMRGEVFHNAFKTRMLRLSQDKEHFVECQKAAAALSSDAYRVWSDCVINSAKRPEMITLDDDEDETVKNLNSQIRELDDCFRKKHDRCFGLATKPSDISRDNLYRGLYFHQLQECLRWFPREQVLVMDNEELRKHPTESLNAVLQHVGFPLVRQNITPNDDDNAWTKFRASFPTFEIATGWEHTQEKREMPPKVRTSQPVTEPQPKKKKKIGTQTEHQQVADHTPSSCHADIPVRPAHLSSSEAGETFSDRILPGTEP